MSGGAEGHSFFARAWTTRFICASLSVKALACPPEPSLRSPASRRRRTLLSRALTPTPIPPPQLRGKLRGIFIHKVIPSSLQLGEPPSTAPPDPDACPVSFFSTYVAAGVAAYKRGLLSRDDIHDVAKAALRDFDDLRALHPDCTCARPSEARERCGRAHLACGRAIAGGVAFAAERV